MKGGSDSVEQAFPLNPRIYSVRFPSPPPLRSTVPNAVTVRSYAYFRRIQATNHSVVLEFRIQTMPCAQGFPVSGSSGKRALDPFNRWLSFPKRQTKHQPASVVKFPMLYNHTPSHRQRSSKSGHNRDNLRKGNVVKRG